MVFALLWANMNLAFKESIANVINYFVAPVLNNIQETFVIYVKPEKTHILLKKRKSMNKIVNYAEKMTTTQNYLFVMDVIIIIINNA